MNNLSRKFVPAPKNEALVHKNRLICSPAAKATIFAKSFAKVCRLKKCRSDRQTTKRLRKSLDAKGPMTEDCRPYSIFEMLAAIRQMKGRSAPGPDKIAPLFLKKLGSTDQHFLLRLFNWSWSRGRFPHAWRTADVIPILKKANRLARLIHTGQSA